MSEGQYALRQAPLVVYAYTRTPETRTVAARLRAKATLNTHRVQSASPENDASTTARQKPAGAKQSTRPTDAPFAKDSRIAIIGAGPAGLTMAYELQKKGYTRVCSVQLFNVNTVSIHGGNTQNKGWMTSGV